MLLLRKKWDLDSEGEKTDLEIIINHMIMLIIGIDENITKKYLVTELNVLSD